MKSRVQSNKKDPSNINTLQVSNITLVEYLWFHEYITQVALVKLNFIKTTFLFTRKYRITKFKITNQYLQTVLKIFGLLQKSVTSSWWVFFFPLKSHDVPNRNYFNSLLSGLQSSRKGKTLTKTFQWRLWSPPKKHAFRCVYVIESWPEYVAW